MIPCLHWLQTSSHEYRWNSTSCPDGVPRKKKGVSTAKTVAPIASSGAQSSLGIPAMDRSFTIAPDFSRVFLEQFSFRQNQNFSPSQFNSDLILLKSLRNARTIRYSHWGGTDHEELRDPRQRRGSGSSILRKTRSLSPSEPAAFDFLPIPTEKSPLKPAREAFCTVKRLGFSRAV